jgi:acylpyruvate hydrolase
MKIICVGRNYVDHIKELSNDRPTDPVIFIKPDTALLDSSQAFYYPAFSSDVHYELELVFRIGKVGKNIESKFAHKYIDGIGLGRFSQPYGPFRNPISIQILNLSFRKMEFLFNKEILI